MTKIEALSEHDVLPAEVVGDTLIVMPHGDLLSHDIREFRAELSSLKQVLKKPDLKHMIVDLSGSDYFGSQMLGGLVELKNELDEDGRAVLCDLSESQEYGLRILHMEDQFEVVSTRQVAVRTVAKLNMRDYARKLLAPATVLTLVAAVWGVFESPLAYRVFSSGLDDNYQQLATLWLQYREGIPNALSSEETLYWEENFQKKVALTRGLMSDRRWYMTDDARLLGEAAAALDDLVQSRSVNEFNRYADFIKRMHLVRRHLAERTGVEVAQLRRATADDDFPADTFSDDSFPGEPSDDEHENGFDGIDPSEESEA